MEGSEELVDTSEDRSLSSQIGVSDNEDDVESGNGPRSNRERSPRSGGQKVSSTPLAVGPQDHHGDSFVSNESPPSHPLPFHSQRAPVHSNVPLRAPLPRSAVNLHSHVGTETYSPVYYSTEQAYLPQVYPMDHVMTSNLSQSARDAYHPHYSSPVPVYASDVAQIQHLERVSGYQHVPSAPYGPLGAHSALPHLPPRPHSSQDYFRPSKHSRHNSQSSSTSLRRLRDVDRFDASSTDDDRMVGSDDESSSEQAFSSSRHSRHSRHSRKSHRSQKLRTEPVTTVVHVESPTERLKRHRRLGSLIMICSLVLLTGLWEILETDNYCVPSDILTMHSAYEAALSDGTVTILSTKFTQSESLSLHITLRNTGRALANPTFRVFYYNPNDQRPGSKMAEVIFYLKDCKSAIRTGVQTIHLQIPFPSEKALQMAIDLRASLHLRMEGEGGRIVLSDSLLLPSEIIFAGWKEKLASKPCRIMVFGEQGSAKSTMLNDFLNLLHSSTSRINYTPPPISIQDAGTLGVVRISVPEDVATPLETTIIAFDTEGSQQGQFLIGEDLTKILSNPPKSKYLAGSRRRSASTLAHSGKSIRPQSAPNDALEHFWKSIEALKHATDLIEVTESCQRSKGLTESIKQLRVSRRNQNEAGILLKRAFRELKRVPPCLDVAETNQTQILDVPLILDPVLPRISRTSQDVSDIPLNDGDPIDFVLFMINANSLSVNEDRETVLNQHTYQSYLTVARAISRHNEMNPSRSIQPIKLITFGNVRRSNVSTWCNDLPGQEELADIVNKNLGDDPNPILVYQTSYQGLEDADRIYLLQSMSRLVQEMIAKLQPRRVAPQPEEFFAFRFLRKLRQSLLRAQTLDLIKYLHTSILWIMGCFIVI